MRTEDIGTEVFFLPAAAHTEKDGTLHQHPADAAVAPPGGRAGRRRAQRPVVHLPPRPPDPGEAGRLGRRDGPAGPGPHLGLPGRGAAGRAGRRGGAGRDQRLGRRRQAAVGVHAAEGRRLDRLRLLDLLRGLRRRRQPGGPPQAADASRTGWRRSGAGPGRPTGGSSTTAPRPTRTASRGASARRWSGGTPTKGKWTGHDVARLHRRQARRTTGPPDGRHRPGRRSPAPTRSSCRPTARAGCSRRPGWSTARCPTHYEPQDSPFPNPLYGQQRNPVREIDPAPATTGSSPSGDEPGSDVFPYVATTYRLTEHHTAGGMIAVAALPVRAAAGVLLRGLARAGRRAGPGARGLGHDRHRAQRDRGAGAGHRADAAARACRAGRSTRSGCPTTGAPNGLHHRRRRQRARRTWRSTRTCTSRRSRRWPATSARAAGRAGPRCVELVREYRRRAGITDDTGTEM